MWIKHKDYFSESYKPTLEESGMPLNYFVKKLLGKDRPAKFGYEDAWGDIVLRNETYLKINNLIPQIQSGRFILDIINDIREQQERYHKFEKNDLVCTDMERFWENIVKETKKYLEEVVE